MKNKYTVCITSEYGTEYALASFTTEKEARDFCNYYDGTFVDENEFHWEMSICYGECLVPMYKTV